MHRTLPRQFYADADFYHRELERFYFERWVYAGRSDQIPDAGDYFAQTLGPESLLVSRDRDGIGSRVYEPGPYSEREQLLWAFDEIVQREAGRG